MNNRQRTTVAFVCGHRFSFLNPPPKRGEVLYCKECKAERKVLVTVSAFRAVCMQNDLNKELGRSYPMALREARHHAEEFGHVVFLYDGYEHLMTLRPEEIEAGVDIMDTEPPF